MASSDYIIQHNDPNNGSFVIKPYTANGPATPSSTSFYSNPAANYSAISANTSLVLVGKGIVEYGEVVEQNLVYIVEHFAYKTRPMFPMQGQIWFKNTNFTDSLFPSDPVLKGLYVYDGGTWNPIAMSGNSVGDLNMSNFQIVNLADPSTPLGAVNVQYANSAYVLQQGDSSVNGNITIVGNITLDNAHHIELPAAPQTLTQATNKQYVDVAVNNVNDALNTAVTTLQSDIQQNYVADAGGTMTGNFELSSTASFVVDPSTTATIQLGNRLVQAIAPPVSTTDAANKGYVDSSIAQAIANIPPVDTGDGVVFAGMLDSSTGMLTLQRTESLPDVLVSGTFAPFVHTQPTSTVTYDMSVLYKGGLLYQTLQSTAANFPNVATTDVIKALDQSCYQSTKGILRQVFVPQLTGNTLTTLDDPYILGTNRLQVFKNNMKLIQSERATSKFVISAPVPSYGTLINGLSVNTAYNFTLSIDGTDYPLTATTPTTQMTVSQLLTLIQQTINASATPIPATMTSLLLPNGIRIIFNSQSSGNGSSSALSFNAGELFSSISGGIAPINKTIVTTYDYAEIGIAGALSNTIRFTSAPGLTDVIEFLIFP